MSNIILNTDSYKFSHFLFYPENTTEVYSYAESRGGEYDETVFFGLYSYIEEYLTTPITQEDIDEVTAFAEKHGQPFNRAGWQYILDTYSGFLPLEIKGVPEGTLVPTQNVLVTVRNTDPNCAWLTSYIETSMLRIWYPITVATRIYHMKKAMKPFFDRTANNEDMNFSLLDFSSRGCSSHETSQIGGSAYLTMFMGSDSIPAIDYVNKIYNVDMSGFSVPATEHSIMTSYGKENERESLERILNQTPENGIISIVADSWDIFAAIDHLDDLQHIVKDRGLTLVIRPDSGSFAEVLPKVFRKCIDRFPHTVNNKGYIVFDYIKVLWGDGINEKTCTTPFQIAEMHNISAESVMIGSGGGLMQANIDRDTLKFAFKASNVIVDGVSKPICKEPITDPGKRSKKGKLRLTASIDDGSLYTDSLDDPESDHDFLETYYLNGVSFTQDFDEIRKRIDVHLG